MSRKLVLLAVVLAACDSQVDSDHQGTPLAKIGGSVRNVRTQPIVGGAEVAVVWNNSSGSPDLYGSDSVDVAGSFPAQFTLSIFEPPDDYLLNDWQGVKVGVAYIIAGTPGTDYSNETGMLGMEENHLLVYVPQAVPAGSEASIVLRGTPAAGFHVYAVHKLTETEQQTRQTCEESLPNPTMQQIYSQCGGSPWFDDFVPVSTDLATPLEINLVDDFSQIDPPNWT